MDRKVVKIIAIILTVMMLVSILSTSVFAVDWKTMDTTMFDNVTDASNTDQVATNIVGSIIGIVQVVGMGIAIIMLIVMAIKYISAAPSEKAEIKKSVTIYVVGAIVLFAASGILGIIKNFATSNVKAENTTSSSAIVNVVDTLA